MLSVSDAMAMKAADYWGYENVNKIIRIHFVIVMVIVEVFLWEDINNNLYFK